MITVAMVLRSGGQYAPAHVRALGHQVRERLKGVPHHIRVLSDQPVAGVVAVPLGHGFPGWWSKIELFRPGVFADELVLYLDLDTIVTGDLAPLARYPGDFAMLADFYEPARLASGVMLFRPSPISAAIYERFLADPAGIMRSEPHGDGGWIGRCVPDAGRIQEIWPGLAVSYKAAAVARDGLPDGARLLCFHGRPKPWDCGGVWQEIYETGDDPTLQSAPAHGVGGAALGAQQDADSYTRIAVQGDAEHGSAS